MRSTCLILALTLSSPAFARRDVDNLFGCAALLDKGAVQSISPEFERSFGTLYGQTHRRMQDIFKRSGRGFARIPTMLELSGGWARAREVSFDQRSFAALSESLEDQRLLKTISYRLWRTHTRTPALVKNLLAVREVIVGDSAIRAHLLKVRAAALTSQMEADERTETPVPPRQRLRPARVARDLLAVLSAGALTLYNARSVIRAVAAGEYVTVAANAAAFAVVARPILQAKIRSLYGAGGHWWRGRGEGEVLTEPRQMAAAMQTHLDEVLRLVNTRNKPTDTFAYYGASVDLDLSRSGASDHPLRRKAPTSEEILDAARANAGGPQPFDPRTVEVDALYGFDAGKNQFVYAVHAWEPQYPTESLWWGW